LSVRKIRFGCELLRAIAPRVRHLYAQIKEKHHIGA
jgi:hypothetical protein